MICLMGYNLVSQQITSYYSFLIYLYWTFFIRWLWTWCRKLSGTNPILKWFYIFFLLQHSLLNVILVNFKEFLLGFMRHPKQLHCICNYVLLNLKIKWCVSCKRRGMIYFNKPRLQFLIDEYIKSKNLKAERIYSVTFLILLHILLEKTFYTMTQTR